MIEAASTVFLGAKGMYKMHDPDTLDTQKDLMNNMLGCLTALFFETVLGRGTESESRE
jgi:hypothetical protein